MFLSLVIKGINDIRLISSLIHVPSHELEDTDTSTPPTRIISKRILVELLGIREESVILYLWGMNPLACISLLFYIDTCLLHLGVWCTAALMLDGDSLFLLDVMKVGLYYMFYPITIVRESGSSLVGLCIICVFCC
jgi:hypothetical protein